MCTKISKQNLDLDNEIKLKNMRIKEMEREIKNKEEENI